MSMPRYCRNCKWFHAKRARGSNDGECAEPYWQTVEYIRTCRTATMCCTRWTPKTDHTALSDDYPDNSRVIQDSWTLMEVEDD